MLGWKKILRLLMYLAEPVVQDAEKAAAILKLKEWV